MVQRLKVAPLQAWGLGDIVFCQRIANLILNEGHEVWWGVNTEFVEGLNRAYPNVNFVEASKLPIDYNRKDQHDSNGYRVLPLRWADSIMGVHYNDCMKSKYMLFGLDWQDWKLGNDFKRNMFKEKVLFKTLKLQPNKYILVNNHFQSDAKGNAGIRIDSPLPVVNMTPTDGYSLFDWCYILENASEIHTVSTSIIYLLELLDIKCPIHLYPRPTDPNFDQVKYLFTKPYVLHGQKG